LPGKVSLSRYGLHASQDERCNCPRKPRNSDQPEQAYQTKRPSTFQPSMLMHRNIGVRNGDQQEDICRIGISGCQTLIVLLSSNPADTAKE
jgi:hypothetical protein